MNQLILTDKPVIIVEDNYNDYVEICNELIATGFTIYWLKDNTKEAIGQTFQRGKDVINLGELNEMKSFVINEIEACFRNSHGIWGVVCDYSLNKCDNIYWSDIIQHIRRYIPSDPDLTHIFQQIPIIGCTSSNDPDVYENFVRNGANKTLMKDHIDNLWKILKELIEKE